MVLDITLSIRFRQIMLSCEYFLGIFFWHCMVFSRNYFNFTLTSLESGNLFQMCKDFLLYSFVN